VALADSRHSLVAVVAWRAGWCNADIAEGWRGLGLAALLLTPAGARERLGPGDVAINRLDVLPSLDGVEPGLRTLAALERSGVHVVNSPAALVAAHDKLETARRLLHAGIPHPRTVHVAAAAGPPPIAPPLVVKPRFGSWAATSCSAGRPPRRRGRSTARGAGRGPGGAGRSCRPSSSMPPTCG
jgi:hypothetical protein